MCLIRRNKPREKHMKSLYMWLNFNLIAKLNDLLRIACIPFTANLFTLSLLIFRSFSVSIHIFCVSLLLIAQNNFIPSHSIHAVASIHSIIQLVELGREKFESNKYLPYSEMQLRSPYARAKHYVCYRS